MTALGLQDKAPVASEGMPGALAPEERRRITTRLGAGLAGIGLLSLGTFLVRFAPDQWQIGELFRFLAAAVVGIPTLISGVRGVVTGDTRRATDQLVSIAIPRRRRVGRFHHRHADTAFSRIGASVRRAKFAWCSRGH